MRSHDCPAQDCFGHRERTAADPKQKGVSLIEALVAIAIMAFGMLGLAGLQSSLRANADISKQRSEAVRIAQQALEAAKGYTDYAGYLAIASQVPVVVADTDSNTDYVLELSVTSPPGAALAPYKEVVAAVTWTDRLNSSPPPSVALRTRIAWVPPALLGSLSAPWSNVAVQNPSGRSRWIPREAKLLDGGISVFKPPQPAGSDTLAWVFDNNTGLMKACTVAAGSIPDTFSRSDLGAECLSSRFDLQLLSGYIRFASSGASLGEALQPTGTPLNLDVQLTLTSTGHTGEPVCFDDAPTALSTAQAKPGFAVSYFCAIPRRPEGTWAGRSRIRPLGWLDPVSPAWTIHSAAGSDIYKVCRYSTMAADGFTANDGKTNIDHPLDYSDDAARTVANQPLTGQNFLVIRAADTCPTHAPNASDAVNGNTRLHQDGGLIHTNPS